MVVDNMDIAKMVRRYVDNCKEREPIFVKKVKVPTECENERDLNFDRLERENKIRKYKKGIYYKPKVTVFGELGIDTEQLILKLYIKEDSNINGYITGPAIWNKWGITTQVPNRIWVATNLIDKTTEKKNLKVRLIKPKTEVNNYNYKLLQFLDVIDQAYKIQDINWDNYIDILLNKLGNLDVEQLRCLINLTKHYKKFVNNFVGALIDTKFENIFKCEQLKQEIFTLKIKANIGKRYKLVYKAKLKNVVEWGFY